MVDVMTTYSTEADVFACYIALLLADIIAKTYVVDVMSTYCNMRRCYLADVITIYVCHMCYTTEADVIACYILFYFIIGWCYCQYVADVMATFGVMWWQNVIAKWQME